MGIDFVVRMAGLFFGIVPAFSLLEVVDTVSNRQELEALWNLALTEYARVTRIYAEFLLPRERPDERARIAGRA